MSARAFVSQILRSPFQLTRTHEIPDRLLVKPVDPWPGCVQDGHAICAQSQDILSSALNTWPTRFDRFFWLRDLRAMGGADARACAKALTSHWIEQYGFQIKNDRQRAAWRVDVLGERVSNWIAHHDFIDSCSRTHDEEFHTVFLDSIYRQSIYLAKKIGAGLYDLEALKAYKGLLYAGLAFEGHEGWVTQALDGLRTQSDKQFLKDGGHISRSPMQLMRGLQIMLDIKAALNAAAYPVPKYIDDTITRAAQALKFFRYSDKKLALFHGTFKGCDRLLDSIIAQAGMRGRPAISLKESGYECMQMGRSVIMFDGGMPPPWPCDRYAHAAPLAFEMNYGKDRIFVSCGTHAHNDEWQQALRATAAHNTLTIDHRNAYEINNSAHFSRMAQNVTYKRSDKNGVIAVQSKHDGYLPLNGIVHHRDLCLENKGYVLRGYDTVCAKIEPSKTARAIIRFHLHPRVIISLSQDGQKALLRLSNGIGWRFETLAGTLSLENSIYLGDGKTPRKTQQIVIQHPIETKETTIPWVFQREGSDA